MIAYFAWSAATTDRWQSFDWQMFEGGLDGGSGRHSSESAVDAGHASHVVIAIVDYETELGTRSVRVGQRLAAEQSASLIGILRCIASTVREGDHLTRSVVGVRFLEKCTRHGLGTKRGGDSFYRDAFKGALQRTSSPL